MLTSKRAHLQTANLFKWSPLSAKAFSMDLRESDPLLKPKPDLDQDGVAREVAKRSLSVPSGFVNLMVALRCSPAIQRANKVHSSPETTTHALTSMNLGAGRN